MKNAPYLLLIFLLVLLFSCSNEGSNQKSEPIPHPQANKETNNKTIPTQANISYFVTAVSGLNYRSAPKGEVLGKFQLNTELKIKERTGLFEEIKDGHEVLKGEWVRVELDKKNVYVFDAFLSVKKANEPSPEELYFNLASNMVTDIPIYSIENLDFEDDKSHSFFSCSDNITLSMHPDSMLIDKKYMETKELPKVHTLDKKYRFQFLSRLEVKESDNIYIYNYVLDTVFIRQVSQAQVLARANPYLYGEELDQSDFMIGFGFTEDMSYKNWNKYYYNTLVFIGKENPFSPGNSAPVLWKKIENSLLPVHAMNTANRNIVKHYKKKNSYKFVNKGLTYYLQQYDMAYYLEVISADNRLVHSKIFIDSEGVSLADLMFITEKSNKIAQQWTGKMFKDKPPVILGFEYHSFDCQTIDFLELEARSIRISCDNRH